MEPAEEGPDRRDVVPDGRQLAVLLQVDAERLKFEAGQVAEVVYVVAFTPLSEVAQVPPVVPVGLLADFAFAVVLVQFN